MLQAIGDTIQVLTGASDVVVITFPRGIIGNQALTYGDAKGHNAHSTSNDGERVAHYRYMEEVEVDGVGKKKAGENPTSEAEL